MTTFTFERLNAWQKARIVVRDVYRLLRQFPPEENYGLSDQLRRASVSVASNLAEGSGRLSTKEKIHFCHMAYGSLMEVMCQLILAHDLGYIDKCALDEIRLTIEEAERVINGYHNYLKNEANKL